MEVSYSTGYDKAKTERKYSNQRETVQEGWT